MTSTPYDRQVAARANYDPNIKVAYPVLCAKEENWAASTSNQSRKRDIERGANNYLLKLVEPTWIRPLKNETTFFTRVTPIEMLAEMTKASGGLERVDTVNLLVSLTQLWELEPRVPEYLNRIRDSQKKAKRAGLPFQTTYFPPSHHPRSSRRTPTPRTAPSGTAKSQNTIP